MKILLLTCLVTLSLGTINGQAPNNVIKMKNGTSLFIHTENKFAIETADFGLEEIKLETDNGIIKRFFKGNYMIKPNSMGQCVIAIYNKDKSKKLATEKFLVTISAIPEIRPVFYSKEYQIKNNEIPKDRLEDLRGFSTMVFSQNQILFLIDNMKLEIYSENQGNSAFVTNGKLTDEMKEKIKVLEKGDLIILKEIKVKSVTDYAMKDTPDQVLKISPTVYFVE